MSINKSPLSIESAAYLNLEILGKVVVEEAGWSDF